MILVVDPGHFIGITTAADAQSLGLRIRRLLLVRREFGARLLAVPDYWAPLWTELIRPLELQFPELRNDLAELRRASTPAPGLAAPPGATRVWGFNALFSQQAMGGRRNWVERMTSSLLKLAVTGEEVLVFVRLIEGRNTQRRISGHSQIQEITRWRLYVQARTERAIPLPCIRSSRNVSVRWTTRFDQRLPGPGPGVRYPFCPPQEWWKRDTTAVAVRSGKPAFIDGLNNGWSRPNIPGGAGYHWDVYISSHQLAAQIGIDQLNIVEFGAPAAEREPGTIHHIPADRRHLVNDVGWTC